MRMIKIMLVAGSLSVLTGCGLIPPKPVAPVGEYRPINSSAVMQSACTVKQGVAD